MEEAGFNACILQYAALLKDDFCHPAIYRGWSAVVVTAFQQRSDFVTTKNKLSPMGGYLHTTALATKHPGFGTQICQPNTGFYYVF